MQAAPTATAAAAAGARAAPLVSYVFAAEFDIDAGSVLRHAVPALPPGLDEHLLAEWMLPDGVHNHPSDWSIFFLNRPVVAGGASHVARGSMGRARSKGSRRVAPAAVAQAAAQLALDDVRLPVRAFVGGSDAQLASAASGAVPSHDDSATGDMHAAAGGGGAGGAGAAPSNASAQAAEPGLPDGEWRRLHGAGEACEVVVTGDRTLLVRVGDRTVLSIPVSPTIQQLVDSATFVSLFEPERPLVGLLFESEADMQRFGDAMSRFVEQGPSKADDAAPSQSEGDRAVEGGAAESTPQTPQVATQADAPFLFCINHVCTVKDPSAPRGARVRAVAIASPYQFFNVLRSVLSEVLRNSFDALTRPLLESLRDTLNSVDLSLLPVLSREMQLVTRQSHVDTALSVFEASVQFGNTQHKLRLPLNQTSDDVSANHFQLSVRDLLVCFRQQTLVIFNALLMGKRVMFLGYGLASDAVCRAVLSALLLVSPPLGGVLRPRVFPYCNLFSLEFLDVPGFVAGATNPMFRQHRAWWDVLCDLATGEVLFGEDRAPWIDAMHACSGHDRRTMDNVLELAEQSSVDEKWIRRQFELLTLNVLGSVFGWAEADEVVQSANRMRVKLINESKLYEAAIASVRESMSPLATVVRTLMQSADLQTDVLRGALDTIVHLVRASPDGVIDLLSQLHESDGGIVRIASCLLHENDDVRELALQLCQVIDAHKIGKSFMGTLNMFLLMAYARLSRRAGPSVGHGAHA